MNHSHAAKLIGALFIIQMVAAILSYSVILEPILYATDYLNELATKPELVKLAMLLDLLCGAAVFGIAILFFPILKKFNERIALWYVGQRLTELVGFMVSGLLLLTVLKIGINLETTPNSEVANLETIAYYFRNARGNVQNISLLIYCLGAWSLYGLLFQFKLVPHFISVWGLIAVSLLFIEITANIFGTSAGGMMIMMPLGLNEIFLGLWLIVKGFNKDITLL
ncbi:DUF4386 domain-containing protein [Ekhidna sp.]|uniref:DUF4386 domain-containing protein n=1 Tax=Ekhidna sp. TaxID=2608089 RepID=UPI0032977DF9